VIQVQRCYFLEKNENASEGKPIHLRREAVSSIRRQAGFQ
jgi:hypothetical protein